MHLSVSSLGRYLSPTYAGEMDNYEATRKQIAERIRKLRQDANKSQETVAGAAHMAVSFYAATERATSNPGLKSLVRIADALKKPLSEIVCGEELDQFRRLDELIAGVPAVMRPLVLKLCADLVSIVKETEKVLKTREAKR